MLSRWKVGRVKGPEAGLNYCCRCSFRSLERANDLMPHMYYDLSRLELRSRVLSVRSLRACTRSFLCCNVFVVDLLGR